MEAHEEQAIVLDSRVSGESAKLVSLLTEHGQLLQAFAPGAAASRRRFPGALEPGCRVRVRWTVAREGGWPRLQEAIVEKPPPAPDPVDRLYATAHMVELARAFARQGVEEPRLFRLLVACLAALEAGVAIDPLLRYAELWTLRLAGLWPDTRSCAVCGAPLSGGPRYMLPDAGAVCAEHRSGGAQRLEDRPAAWADSAARTPPQRLPGLDAASDRDLRRVLVRWIVGFTDRPLSALDGLDRLRRGGAARKGER